ncbi:RING-H2 finger protein ATL72 [Capsicum annuum]|nr:RING-H2 finger protein ATL72 [Capsicum annuum]
MEVYHRPYRRLLLDPHPVIPPSSTVSKPHHGYSNEANFDTNMVIILAALLCALICALGLNSIVRCALRCSRRFAFESENATAARLAAAGLKKSTLRQLPVSVYGSGVNIPATDCPICLGEFMDGEKVRVLPRCHHGFHVKCIDIWLALHSSCPTCRQSLLEQNTTTAVDVETGLGQPATAASGGHADATPTTAADQEVGMIDSVQLLEVVREISKNWCHPSFKRFESVFLPSSNPFVEVSFVHESVNYV